MHFCLFALTSRWTFTSIRNNYLYTSTSKDRGQANLHFLCFFLQTGLNKERASSCFFLVQLKVNYKQVDSAKRHQAPGCSLIEICGQFMKVVILFSNECQLQIRKDDPINMVIWYLFYIYDIHLYFIIYMFIKICHQEGKHCHQCPQESLQMNVIHSKITSVLPFSTNYN